jgi:hypothetical protein
MENDVGTPVLPVLDGLHDAASAVAAIKDHKVRRHNAGALRVMFAAGDTEAPEAAPPKIDPGVQTQKPKSPLPSPKI